MINMDNRMKNSGEDYSLFTAYSNIDGVIIGGMWILSFLCFVGEFEAPLLSFVALAFGLGSAIMLVMRVRRFRDKALGGYITFGRAMLYSLQICFKATLLMAVAATSSLPFSPNEPVCRCWLMAGQGVPPIHMAMIATAKVTANWMSRNKMTYNTMLAISCSELLFMVDD